MTSSEPVRGARVSRVRLGGVAAMVVGAAAALLLGGPAQRLGAVALLLLVAVTAIPWPMPRRERSVASYWLESVSLLLPGVAVLVVAVLAGVPVGGFGVPVGGVAAGVVVGLGLAAATRMPLRMLLRGDLARIVGWSKPGHALARGGLALPGAPLEEALYRGLLLPAGGAALPVLAVTSAVAFVGSHYLVSGIKRVDRAELATITAGAVAFTGLTVATSSLVPAVVAHLLANAPRVTLDLQRAWLCHRGAIEPEIDII